MKIAIYTSIFGDYDTLIENQPLMDGVDYLCFTDMDLKSDTWKIIKSIPIYSDPNRDAKKYKILPHRYLKNYDYSIWVDGNFTILSDIRDIVKKGEYLAYDHNQSHLDPRDCIYQEYNAIIHLGQQNGGKYKDNPQLMYNQVNRYLDEGYPHNNGLTTNGIMFRNHNNPNIIKVMEEWWLEIKHNSKRDQLSFDYVAWKNNFKIQYIPGDNRNNQYFTLGRHKKKKIMNNKCIIVGNASNILNKKLGNTIDSFENVVRFNRFKINEYKEDLGTKCTHWVVGYNLATDNMAVNNGYFKKNLNRLKLEHPELKQIIIITSTLTKKKDFYKINELKNSVGVELIYKEYKPFFKSKPTSGFMAIDYFLKKFPQISLGGFDFGKSFHYWGCHSIADVPAPEHKHPWTKEKEYVDNLVNNNKINLL